MASSRSHRLAPSAGRRGPRNATEGDSAVNRSFAGLVAAAALALAVPHAADAATRTVLMGAPPAVSGELQKKFASEAVGYFPSTVTVQKGDTVAFSPFGFHNAEFPAKGKKATGLLAPSGKSGQSDAAGQPFWFAELPNFGFNPILMRSSFGKTVSYDGGKRVDSGLPLGDKLKPFKVKFPKTGTFNYFCAIHPDMKGTVKVKSSGRQSESQVKKAVDKQVAAAKKTAATTAKTKAPAETVLLGAAKRFPGGNVDRFAMIPEKLTVPLGTTVTFRMSPESDEVHSATFGKYDEKDDKAYVTQIAKSFESPVFDSRGIYPSEARGSVASYTSNLHGNGFWNSGLLSAPNDQAQLGSANKVTFSEKGTFSFICVIHTFMRGEIVVQ